MKAFIKVNDKDWAVNSAITMDFGSNEEAASFCVKLSEFLGGKQIFFSYLGGFEMVRQLKPV